MTTGRWFIALTVAATSVLVNEIQVGFAAPAVVVQHVKSGRLKALGYDTHLVWSVSKNPVLSPTIISRKS